ncbi:MAG: hypothetical protein AAF135_21325, partial [Bacteroidota bacterium]
MSELARRLITENLKTKDPYLDLGNCDLTDDNFPEEILQLADHLKVLILASEWYEYNAEKAEWVKKESQNGGVGNRLNKIPEALKSLYHLQSLDLRNTNITDITPLQGLAKLQSL